MQNNAKSRCKWVEETIGAGGGALDPILYKRRWQVVYILYNSTVTVESEMIKQLQSIFCKLILVLLCLLLISLL